MRRSNGGGATTTRMKTTPIPVQRTRRPIEQRILTSLNAGKMVPLMAIPLLREDSLSGGSFRVSFQMSETVEILMNAINVRVLTYLVPKLAFDRFNGIDEINRSYEGIPREEGGPVIPWFETMTANSAAGGILQTMGKHAKVGAQINTDYIEAYNQIWNFRAKNRSPDLDLRSRLDVSLAPSFWEHQTFSHIVPDFDQAIIDGEISLNVVNSKMPVKGFGLTNAGTSTAMTIVESGSSVAATGQGWNITEPGNAGSAGNASMGFFKDASQTSFSAPDVWAELQDNGITVSLSNIELARKTQAFAQLRRQYNGHSDEYIIDLLMDGITIPEQAWKQPMLLSDVSTVFGMSKRYASDGASLTESVVNGATYVDVRINCPRVPMGGVIMMVAEIAPEQLFERQKDPYLHATSVDVLPQFLRDTLDPEKVSIVTNDYVDVQHSVPNGTFGYAPLNHEWAKSQPNVGGRFFRPDVDGAFDEDRQRIWAVETKDPVLSEDFYLVSEMNYKPFVVTAEDVDHFEVLVRGNATIMGNTVFGGLLIEATDDYEKVLAEAPQDRIDKPVAP
ncbi:MAG: major capsid protein [Microviridae sp.]|nr:MAG: major capsid protein [Microviridae sp.]